MQTDEELFNRRNFLQWGIGGAVGIGAQLLLPSIYPQEHPSMPSTTGEQAPPAHPLVLRSAELEVILDPDRGLPYEYRLLKNTSRLRGDNTGSPLNVTLCRRDPWTFDTLNVTPEGRKGAKTSVYFRFRAESGGSPAARFDVRYSLRGSTLVVTLENVWKMSRNCQASN